MPIESHNISIRLWSDGFCYVTDGPDLATGTRWHDTPVIVNGVTGEQYVEQLRQAAEGRTITGITLVAMPQFSTETLEPTQFALVPKHLFKPENADVWLPGYNNKDCVVVYDMLQDDDACLVYAVPKILYDLQAGCQVSHVMKELFNGSLSRTMSAYCEGRCVFIIYRKFGELQYANCFRYNEAADVAYYVLNVYKQQEIDPNEPLFLKASDDIVNLLGGYLRIEDK